MLRSRRAPHFPTRPARHRLVAAAAAVVSLVALTACEFVDPMRPILEPTSAFQGLTPARLLDTRTGSPTIDARFSGIGTIGDAATLDLTVTGRGGVPATGASAVALNITVTEPTVASYLTVFPTGQPRPTASNLNFAAGQTVANMAIVPIGTDGKVSLFNLTGTAHVIVDVLGWFPQDNTFRGLVPARLLDTRPGEPTTDATFTGAGPLAAGQTLDVTVVGRGGVPATGVGAVALNVTAIGPTASGFVTVHPAGSGRPTASSLNFTPGRTVPNMVIVGVGTGGAVSLFNSAGLTGLAVDVLGWFPADGSFTGLTPARLVDTRPGQPTVDGASSGSGAAPAASVVGVNVLGRGGVPSSGVGAVALNVTITEPAAAGFATVFPAGSVTPTASTLNYRAGDTVPNFVVVPVGDSGSVQVYVSGGPAHVVVDVLGWFPPSYITPVVSRVSTTAGGTQFTSTVTNDDLSADGNLVAFTTLAGDLPTEPLGTPDTNSVTDVYVKNRATGAIELASLTHDGQLSNAQSSNARMSADGRYVVFTSRSTNMVPGLISPDPRVYVRDLQTDTTELVSTGDGGAAAGNDPSISDDGRYVVFSSLSTTLVAGTPSSGSNVFLRDRTAGTTTLVSTRLAASTADSTIPVISGDGSTIAYWTLANDIVAGDANPGADVVVRARASGDTELATVSSTEVQGTTSADFTLNPTAAGRLDLSADGTTVLFSSNAPDLVAGDTNGITDVFVRDRTTGTTHRVSSASSTSGTFVQSTRPSAAGSLSSDGSRLAYTQGTAEVFIHDRPTELSFVASVAAFFNTPNGLSTQGLVSGDGRTITYVSTSTDIVADDTNGVADLFVIDLTP